MGNDISRVAFQNAAREFAFSPRQSRKLYGKLLFPYGISKIRIRNRNSCAGNRNSRTANLNSGTGNGNSRLALLEAGQNFRKPLIKDRRRPRAPEMKTSR